MKLHSFLLLKVYFSIHHQEFWVDTFPFEMQTMEVTQEFDRSIIRIVNVEVPIHYAQHFLAQTNTQIRFHLIFAEILRGILSLGSNIYRFSPLESHHTSELWPFFSARCFRFTAKPEWAVWSTFAEIVPFTQMSYYLLSSLNLPFCPKLIAYQQCP